MNARRIPAVRRSRIDIVPLPFLCVLVGTRSDAQIILHMLEIGTAQIF